MHRLYVQLSAQLNEMAVCMATMAKQLDAFIAANPQLLNAPIPEAPKLEPVQKAVSSSKTYKK
jgi:hypothetical protein